MLVKVCQNIFDLKDDERFHSIFAWNMRFYFVRGQNCHLICYEILERYTVFVCNVFIRLNTLFAVKCELIISHHTEACMNKLFTFYNAICLDIDNLSIIRNYSS